MERKEKYMDVKEKGFVQLNSEDRREITRKKNEDGEELETQK